MTLQKFCGWKKKVRLRAFGMRHLANAVMFNIAAEVMLLTVSQLISILMRNLTKFLQLFCTTILGARFKIRNSIKRKGFEMQVMLRITLKTGELSLKLTFVGQNSHEFIRPFKRLWSSRYSHNRKYFTFHTIFLLFHSTEFYTDAMRTRNVRNFFVCEESFAKVARSDRMVVGLRWHWRSWRCWNTKHFLRLRDTDRCVAVLVQSHMFHAWSMTVENDTKKMHKTL